MDQLEEKEENRFQESTDRQKEEVHNNSQESVDQLKGEEEEDRKNPEEATLPAPAATRFAHPCSLLQYLARACASCLGLRDSFCPRRPPPPEPAATATDTASAPSQEQDDDKKTSAVVATRARAAVMRPQKPRTPVEGSGGNGGQHH
ncbi:hypothetical protein GUJ93_ZPchr0004g39070 [Zizania palustris]|uniref:Uncharacterized protein n=1 Tax=Zizania palustris TaxID=103762 RepID=A0A8J5VZM0_ZIZPA|nr:hypothetical protein GUJ93_ZPchr0004g39070 [Zizania palustris]